MPQRQNWLGTFLGAVINAVASRLAETWPLRSEQEYRSWSAWALTPSLPSILWFAEVVTAEAETISRRTFQRELNQVLPEALDEMTKGSGEDQLACGTSGPCTGHYRPRHGGVLQICGRARSRRHSDEGSHGASTHQSLSRSRMTSTTTPNSAYVGLKRIGGKKVNSGKQTR